MNHRIPVAAATLGVLAFGLAGVAGPSFAGPDAPSREAYGHPSDRHLAQATTTPVARGADPGDRGRYLVRIAGCNDCHTANYALADGNVPEKDWLTGDAVGWQGPWGTTYPPNLRTFFQTLDEGSWLVVARSRQFRPPMPSPSLRAMSDDDLRAIYRYVRALGPAGVAAPAYVPPGQATAGPVVTFPAPPK